MNGNRLICKCTNLFICFGSEQVGSLYIYGRSWRSVIVCRFLSLCLWTNIECAYCVAIILICLNVFFIFVLGSSSIFF